MNQRTRIEVAHDNVERSFTDGLLTIGGRLGADVVLHDPMVADRHCTIEAGDGFTVRDNGSVTGTWLDGKRVLSGAELRNGAWLVLGATRIQVAIGDDDGVRTLRLSVEPMSFSWTPATKGAFDNDPDQLVRSEVAFGRFPTLHLLNRLAGIVAAAGLIAALFVGAVMGPLADPGPLLPPHALLASGAAPPADGHGAFANCRALADEQGCNVCHATGAGAVESKCRQCHGQPGEMAGAGSWRHPYHNDGVLAALPGVSSPEQVCVLCHSDHGGGNEHGLKPAAAELQGKCELCHHDGEGAFDRDALTARARADVPKQQPRPFAALRFPHDAHLRKQVPCAICHHIDEAVRSDRDNGVPDDPGRQDFVDVPYETCASCHVAGSPPVQMTAAEQTKWRADDRQWRVTWHGTDDAGSHCRTCHAEVERGGARVIGPERKTVARLSFTPAGYAADRARYRVEVRSHAEQFTAHAAGKACTQCHLNGRVEDGGAERSDRVFWHGLHLAAGSLQPGARAGAISSDASQGCASCHGDLAGAGADHLTPAADGAFRWPDDEAHRAVCRECHRDGERANRLVAAPASPTSGSAARDVPDFPHGVHVRSDSFGRVGQLANGCFACHEFVPGDSTRTLADVPTTRPGAADCTACHAGHAAVGGGDCQQCHPAAAGESNSFLVQAKVTEPAWPSRPWPAPNGFSHLSRGHREEQCSGCHQGPAIEGAADLAAVRVPDESASLCRDCHLQKQFHWR